jgi:glycosyltransferase involved in cell wall biosynthesis
VATSRRAPRSEKAGKRTYRIPVGSVIAPTVLPKISTLKLIEWSKIQQTTFRSAQLPCFVDHLDKTVSMKPILSEGAELCCGARVRNLRGVKVVMKIAQVAPLIESVPPRLYGGTERIVSYLTEELVRLGHDVTLFASGDSISGAELVPCCTRALRLDSMMPDVIPHYMLMVDNVRERAGEFDVVHFHIDFFHFPLFRSLAGRTLTTLHGRQDLGDLGAFFSRFGEMPLVSISDDQRKPLPHTKFMTTIHHGIPADLHRPSFEKGSYLAFLGRISPEKRPDRAIKIARAAGIPLKIAAKVDKVDGDYFRNVILPLVDGQDVEFVGEINERQKTKFLGEAGALLFPVDWPEPFGLVMIEAMACGTPVLAFRCGSIPEVIEDGITGKVVNSEQEAVAALPAILSYDRRAVRQRFEERFTATRMAKDYVSAYSQLLRMRTSNSPRPRRRSVNGGNGLIPMSIENPLPALVQAGANSEADPIRISAVDLSTMLPSRDLKTIES